MKNILITGKNSYIGISLENWLMKEPDSYQVDTIDMKTDSWKEEDFSPYDVVFHVAGIAHIKETKENEQFYYKVNRDLAYEIAQKAKLDGVKQFIFLSSMSVYGMEEGIINEDTMPNPKTAYGKSKLQAEELIKSLQDNTYTVAILRPPMVYGKGCKGNYPRLAKLALKTPIFPKVDNKRSMIYIDNLSEFVKYVIDNSRNGTFLPQNKDYVNTSEMVKLIAKANGENLVLTKIFNPIINFIDIPTIKKIFGNLVYESSVGNNIDFISFEESIDKTEINRGL